MVAPAAIAAADKTFGQLYLSDYAYHAQIEPMAAVASVDPDGKGAEVWDVLCKSCHGDAGRGGESSRLQGIQPPDLTDPARAATFAPGERERIIADGVPGT